MLCRYNFHQWTYLILDFGQAIVQCFGAMMASDLVLG